MKLRTLGLIGAVGVGGAVVLGGGDDQPTVVRVVDGDTIVASVDGEEKRVRLLNVDTPELGRDGTDPECMAVEAKDYLTGVLTPGSEIELRYDEETVDRYGRDLAAVYFEEQLINAELARQGLGVAVIFEPNSKYYREVLTAETQARSDQRGIHDPDRDCSFSAQVETSAAQASALALLALGSMSLAELDSHQDALKSLRNEARDLRKLMSNPREFARAAYSGYEEERKTLDRVIKQLEQEQEKTRQQIDKQQEAEERQREKAEREEQLRSEREKREREQETQPISQQPEIPQQPVSPRPASPAPAPNPAPAPAPAAGYDGYTGCRAYGGNYAMTSRDAQGRSYAKIDCTTKVQIG